MSKTVDQRVVQIQFDNKQFKSGVAETMKQLTKFKSSLNMDESSKSLRNLQSAGKSLNLSKLVSGLQTVTDRFTTLGIVGTTALVNITNKAVDAGVAMLKSLTIDPIKTGLDEYETKINAITTILTNTRSKGTTLDQVNAALAELNEYADLTIYNFAEMTRNIGTFTAAGVDLETSVESIKGIANLAAGSGSSAQQAATAMYQLSQALAAGSIKLMDWNSVVNAGMGGELFQNALKETAKEMGIFVNESVPFRESLRDGWITSLVLTNTLAKFTDTNTELGKSLTDAATQVKTVTQLFSVMQETVQSGWSVSWEQIIGNKEDATRTLTAISDAFSALTAPAADARNEALGFWRAHGGREDVLVGMANLLRLYVEIVKPIKEAFGEMFSPLTGRKLAELSKGFRRFAESLKISEEVSDTIKVSFKALFAIFKIGVLAFKAIGAGIGRLLTELKVLDIDVLGMIRTAAEYVIGIQEMAEETGFFTTVVNKVVDVIVFLIFRFKELAAVTAEWYRNLDKENLLKSMVEGIDSLWLALSEAAGLKKVDLSKIIKWPGLDSTNFTDTLTKVTDALEAFKQKIKDFFTGIDYDKIFNFMKRGAYAGVLLTVIYKIYKIISSTSKVIEAFAHVLESLSTVLKGYAVNLKASALIKVAVAIGILVASLIALTLIEPDKLWTSVAILGAMLGELLIVMILFDKLIKKSSPKDMISLGVAMASMSIGVALLVGAVLKLSKIPSDQLLPAMAALGAMILGLVLAAKSLDKIKTDTILKKSIGLNAFATALLILVKVVEKIGNLDRGVIVQGLIGMGAMLLALGLLLKYAGVAKITTQAGLGILAIAAGIYILSEAVESIGKLPLPQIVKGLGVISVLLAGLGLFAVAMNKGVKGGMDALGRNLLAVSAGLILMSTAMVILSTLSWDGIAKGLVAIAGGLAMMALVMVAMSQANVVAGAAGILITSAALVVFAGAMLLLSALSWEGLAKGLVAIVVGIGAIAAISAVLAASGVLFAMMALAATLLVLSASVGVFGASLLILAAGMAALGAVFLTLKALNSILTGFQVLVLGFLDILIRTSPKLAAAGITMLKDLYKALRDNIGELADIATEAILNFLDGLARNMPKIVDGALNLMAVFIETLAGAVHTYGPRLIRAFNDLLWGIIEMIIFIITGSEVDAEAAFVDLGNSMLKGLWELPQNLWKFFKDLFKEVIGDIAAIGGDFFDAGSDLVKGFVEGMGKGAEWAVDSVQALGTNVLAGFRNVLGIQSPSKETFQDALDYIIGFVNGMAKGGDMATNASEGMARDALAAAEPWSDDYEDVGLAAAKNMADGMENGEDAIANAATKIGKTAFEKSVEWIDERKYYNELALSEELEEWKKIQGKYKEGTDERKKADREVYRLKKELTDKMAAIDKEYYDGIDALRDRYWEEVRALEAEYDQSVKDRAQAIYDAFGLFDSIEPPEIVDGVELTNNLQDQVTAIRSWRTNLETLSEKGISDGLIEELQSMGPQSVAQIQALNKLSQPELDKYVALWKEKNKEAKRQAVSELSEMKIEIKAKILELTKQTGPDLEALKTVWKTKLGELTGINKEELESIRATWDEQIAQLRSDSTQDFKEMSNEIAKIPWHQTGKAIVDGMIKGVNQNRSGLIGAVIALAWSAKTAADETLDINSPSGVFEDIGMYTVQGFVSGIEKHADSVSKATVYMGNKAVDSVKHTIAKISELVNDEIDTTPVIRPVLDLTDVQEGAKNIFGTNSLSVAKNRVASINDKSNTIKTSAGTDSKGDVNYKFEQNNYSPKALSRVEIYRQTKNQFSAMKGVVRKA